MTSTTRSLRPVRALLAGLLAAGAVALPATGAQAAPASFSVSVTGGNSALGTASGTIDASGTQATYSVYLCGQSTYPNSSVTIKAGSASTSHSVSYSGCQTFTGTLNSNYNVTSATITVEGGTFYPGNTYQRYTRDTTVYLANSGGGGGGGTSTPVTRSFSTTARGGYNNATALGTASGSMTAARGATSATYSVQLCGNSTYPNSTVTITAGSASTQHTVSYQSCQTFTGTLNSSYGIRSASIRVEGGTFYPGNTYQRYTGSTSVTF